MIEAKRGPGRPPKVRLEAPVVETPEVLEEKPVNRPAPAKMVEVEIIKKYCPMGQDTEIQKTVPAGSVIKLPVEEAARALKLGIARGTDHTFDN